MKKIDLGQTITILANLGVIGGLIFVGMQLQQDREIALVDRMQALESNFYYWAELVNSSGDLLKTEKTFESFFPQIKKPSFEGLIRSEPTSETMKSKLEGDCNLYVYCGHGAGSKYYPSYFLRDKVRR